MRTIFALVFISAGFITIAGVNGGLTIADVNDARMQQLQQIDEI